MGKEIERKYLVIDKDWKKHLEGVLPSVIRQGYLNAEPERTVRIRLKDQQGFLTIKGKTEGTSRSEFEYPVPVEDAMDMLLLCKGPLIEKYRYTIDINGQTWEIDEFFGENEGLIVAEAELDSEDQLLSPPHWIGEEVTYDRRYYNSNLASSPFRNWQ